MAHKNDQCSLWWVQTVLSSNIIIIHISIMMLISNYRSPFRVSWPKSRNTTSEYIVQNIAILEILLIVSEINPTDVHRSVCEFYIRLLILRIPNKKAHHERNPQNWLENRNFWEHSEWSSRDVYLRHPCEAGMGAKHSPKSDIMRKSTS